MRCQACRTSLMAGSLYCYRCGASVSSASAVPLVTHDELTHAVRRLLPTGYLKQILTSEGRLASERRVVTTLFIDLVNSTGITEQLDPEDVTKLINLAFATMAEPIRRYEGTIARLMGDGMLCLFGAPIAHEDDPVRACRAALEVVKEFRRLAPTTCTKYGVASFTVRVGISTGLAVVGEVGTSDRAEYTAIGDAVNLAARLQAVTEPGTVLICHDTWRLVKNTLACKDMGEVTVRGKTQPIAVHRLLSSGNRTIQTTPAQHHAPMAGRRQELAVCKQAVYDLAENKSSILLISGGAGLGKSRLIVETRLVSPDHTVWIEARSLAHTRSISYWTTRELLRSLLGIGPSITGRKLSAHLRRSVSALFSTEANGAAASSIAGEFITSLCAVLGHVLHAPLRQREKRYIEHLEVGLFHEQIAASVCTYLNLLARTRPLVLVWEDVQWVDVESRQILTALSALSRELPLLLVIVCRPSADQPTQWLDNLIHCAALPVRSVTIEPLSSDECHELLQHLLEVDDVPDHIASPVLSVAEGNPHFLQELTHALLDRGQLVRADSEQLRTSTIGKMDIPRSVQAAILSRVDMLDGASKRVIQTASVLGRIVDPEVVSRMLLPDMLPEACDEAFRILEDRNFVSQQSLPAPHAETANGIAQNATGGRALKHGAPSRQYVFTQTLTQEVVYNSMLKSQRQQLHQRAGEIIESLHSDNLAAVAPILAYHFDQGTEVAKAVQYLCQSAEYSARVCAVDAAADAYLRALFLIEHINSQMDEGLLAALREGLGDVYYLSSSYGQALQQYDQALVTQTISQRRSMLELKRGRLFEKWGRYDEAKKAFESGLDGLATAYDPRLAAKFYSGLCLVYYHFGELTPAGELGQLALELERSVHDERGMAQACNNLGVVAMKQQDWTVAQNYFNESRALWEQLGDSYGLATCYNNLGLVAKEQEDSPTAICHFEQSLALFTRLGNKHGMARVYDNLAELLSLMGKTQQSEEYLGKAVTILSQIGVDSSGPVAELWQSGVW